MAECAECQAELELDERELKKGDYVVCPTCGAELVVARKKAPMRLESVPDEAFL